MKTSRYAQRLVNNGFVGNGCGSGILSHILCWLLMSWFNITIKYSWDWHDAEYSISRSLKSGPHKKDADNFLRENLLDEMGIDPTKDTTSYKYKFATLVHAALVLKGDAAYWDRKPGRVASTLRTIALILFTVWLYSKYMSF